MKGVIAAAVVAKLAFGATAAVHGHGHGQLFNKRHNDSAQVCLPECSTVYSVVLGAPTLVSGPETTAMVTTIATDTTTITVVTSTPAYAAPPQQPAPQQSAPLQPAPQQPAPQQPAPQQSAPQQSAPQQPAPQQSAPQQPAPQQPAITGVAVPPGVHTFQPTTVTISQAMTVCVSASAMTSAPTGSNGATDDECPGATVYHPGTYVAPKQVVTVTKTGYVYYCPLTTATPAPALEASPSPQTPVYDVPAPSTESAAPPTPELPVVTTEEQVPAVPAEKKVPVPHVKKPIVSIKQEVPVAPAPKYSSPSPAPAPKSGDYGKLVSNNDHFGITYTPYESSNGNCKSAAKVDMDMAELKKAGFGTVRVYSTDCSTLKHVGNACEKHQMRMIVGIFVKDKGCSYESPAIKEQVDEISKWAKWNLVSLVVVGNEAIMNGHCSPRQLRDLINTVKHKFHGYTGPYTISETLDVWNRPDVRSNICSSIDVTGANIHPFFNSKVEAKTAGDFVAGQLELLAGVCNHNQTINLECGWPTAGKANGNAHPGKKEQAEAVKSIREKVGSKTVFFSFQNDQWKEAGPFGCEKSWGISSSFAVSSY